MKVFSYADGCARIKAIELKRAEKFLYACGNRKYYQQVGYIRNASQIVLHNIPTSMPIARKVSK